MGILWSLTGVVLFLGIAGLLLKGFWLGSKRSQFRCERCGECCTKYRYIPIDEPAIERIRKAGYKKEDFLDRAVIGAVIKKVNGACFFLKKNKKGYCCSINKIKPDNCNGYPFNKFLGMYGTSCYSCPGVRKLEGKTLSNN
jgi:Fe-S-cluster containining protein